jgi:hypothetical protein
MLPAEKHHVGGEGYAAGDHSTRLFVAGLQSHRERRIQSQQRRIAIPDKVQLDHTDRLKRGDQV